MFTRLPCGFTQQPMGGEVRPAQERAALVALYDATGGAAWSTRDGWLSATPPCSSEGVAQWGSCTAENCSYALSPSSNATNIGWHGCAGICCGPDGGVTGLLLMYNKLRGTLPGGVWRALPHLRQLNLYHASLSGSLPTEVGLSTMLTNVDIDTTLMSGTVPSELSRATGLRYLDWDSTSLSGSLPTELGLATALQYLYTYTTSLSLSLIHI